MHGKTWARTRGASQMVDRAQVQIDGLPAAKGALEEYSRYVA
jgi:hypothetical protein